VSPALLLTLLLDLAQRPIVVSLSNAPVAIDQGHVDSLWEFVQTFCGRKVPPPLVYFTREEEPPASPQFLAFYYDHTRVLRVSPEAVTRRRLALGYPYLVVGHEMLHYALADRIPVEQHHCLFAKEGFEERIADFVVAHDMGHPFLRAMRLEDRCEAELGPHDDGVHGASSHPAH
jgi:hypothetical protein